MHADGTIKSMNMAMMGLLGTVAGASTMGIMGIMDSVAKTFLPRFAREH